MQTSVESLEGNKVKLHVAVPADEFEQAINAAFRKLAREVRIPGFRPGKAPRRILEARFGADVAREQALKDAVPDYYAEAVVSEDIDAIAAPEIDITAGEADGDVEFDAVVMVRPVFVLEGYDDLTVSTDYEVPDETAIDAQVDALRERFADLEDSAEPLVDGAYAQIDITGELDGEPVDALSATDYLYEVGSGIVVAELDEQLHGTRPGAILTFSSELPERFGDRAGETVDFRVVVKDAKRKILPDVTDDWVSEATEFDTVDELRADVAKRLDLMARVRAQMALRAQVLEEVASLVPVAAPEPLVDAELESRLHDLIHRLEAQGLTIPQYLAVTGQEQQAFVDEARVGAEKAVLADLALRAVVVQEEIEPNDEELGSEIERLAERVERTPTQVRRELERRGTLEAVRSDIARGKALQFLVDHARTVDAEGEAVDLTVPEPDATVQGDDAIADIHDGDIHDTDETTNETTDETEEQQA